MSKQEDIEKAIQALGLNEKVEATAAKKPVKKAPGKKIKVAPPVEEETEELEQVEDPNKQAPAGPSKKKSAVELEVEKIEERFLAAADLKGDLSKFPITQANHLQVKTNKIKSDKHGEVFTPLWLVDQMIEDADRGGVPYGKGVTTRDLCSGYGQFSVRLIRYRLERLKAYGKTFDLTKFLTETHSFVELQPNSCYRLLYIFGTEIRLCMGDATKLGDHSLKNATEGIWVWCEAGQHWVDRTKSVQRMFARQKKGSVTAKADAFELEFNELMDKYSKRFTDGKEK